LQGYIDRGGAAIGKRGFSVRTRKVWISTLLLLTLGGAASTGALAGSGLERLKAAIEQVVEEAEGEMGVAIEHLETGQALDVNGDKAFPMASTFKLPILVEMFNQVDQGKVRLDEMVSLEEHDLHLGSGQLSSYIVPGLSLSIENLAYLMMRISDNSATDILLARVGTDNVNSRLATLGVEGISVNRSCQTLILDWLGFDIEKTRDMSYAEIEKMLNEYEPEPGELEAAEARFEDDPRDTATPLGMNQLLEMVFRKQAATPESCTRMMKILLECDTGRNRLRGLLPSSTRVAHKTGTIGGTVNNVGIIYLPHNRGHVIVSVLSKSMEDREAAERAIADVARYAYDYFLFTAPEMETN
jgi:beta-lactamase class A